MPHQEFILLGDAIWLDFVNTTRAPTTSPPDRLTDASAYQRWTRAEKLRADADSVPFHEVLEFRSRLTALAEALSHGRRAPASSIEAINRVLLQTAGREQLTRVRGVWRMVFAGADAPTAIDAIARSVATSLSEPGIAIRRCIGPTCSLFFADSSPNHSRRWCSSLTCGHKVRVERRRTSR